jgi:hypothetical protein
LPSKQGLSGGLGAVCSYPKISVAAIFEPSHATIGFETLYGRTQTLQLISSLFLDNQESDTIRVFFLGVGSIGTCIRTVLGYWPTACQCHG